jgi:hypothetical protein
LETALPSRYGTEEDAFMMNRKPLECGVFEDIEAAKRYNREARQWVRFDEIDRVLRPQGRFLISDFRRSWLGSLSIHLRASYTPGEIRDSLSQSKLQNWKVKDSFFWLSIFSE